MQPPTTQLPGHVAIIMDGNGRWAKQRGLPRIAGHRQGAVAVDRIVTACRKRHIRTLTLYAFSAQNWCRPQVEVNALMELLGEYIRRERKKILDNGIRLTAIGELTQLPKSLQSALRDLEQASSHNSQMTLCLALSYGGQEEITAACRAVAKQVADGACRPEQIDTALLERNLWSHFLGPVDLLIRTSGELRLSNFLLWQCAYAEFHFTPKLWPDFDETDLDAALADYAGRQRRYGDVPET